jgi:hypothetical protein
MPTKTAGDVAFPNRARQDGCYWRGGRVVEGARLLSEWRVISPPEGSNPSLSAREVGGRRLEASNFKPQASNSVIQFPGRRGLRSDQAHRSPR